MVRSTELTMILMAGYRLFAQSSPRPFYLAAARGWVWNGNCNTDRTDSVQALLMTPTLSRVRPRLIDAIMHLDGEQT